MTQENEQLIAIKILDRSYHIKCAPNEVQDLQASAQMVDEKMRKARQASSNTSLDRIAVLTALNLCQELLQTKRQQDFAIDHMNQRIQALHDRVKHFLQAEETETSSQ